MSENKKVSKEAISLATKYWESKKANKARVIVDLIDDAADETMEVYERRMKIAVNEFHEANDILITLKDLENDRKK